MVLDKYIDEKRIIPLVLGNDVISEVHQRKISKYLNDNFNLSIEDFVCGTSELSKVVTLLMEKF